MNVDVNISTKFSCSPLGLHCEAVVSELQLDEAIVFKLLVAPGPRTQCFVQQCILQRDVKQAAVLDRLFRLIYNHETSPYLALA